MARVGDRWTLQVVAALLAGPMRFNELSEALDGIAPNVLSQRIRQLEADGIVVAQAYSTRPVRFSYQLTEAGSALTGAVRLLTHWGSEQSGGPADLVGLAPVHVGCGTPAEPRWWCRTCDLVVEDGDVTHGHPHVSGAASGSDVRWV